MIKVSVSLTNADFSKIQKELSRFKSANSLHIDIMDGNFVPNITFGYSITKLIKDNTKLPLNIHLMTINPKNIYKDFLRFHPESVIIHVENKDILPLLKDLRGKTKVGLAINPETSVSKLTPYLKYLDLVLVMTVHPGFGGQKLIKNCIPKIRQIRQIFDKEIMVDGGINKENYKEIVNSGANTICMGDFILKSKKPGTTISRLKKLKF